MYFDHLVMIVLNSLSIHCVTPGVNKKYEKVIQLKYSL